jgi:hypothetical protein
VPFDAGARAPGDREHFFAGIEAHDHSIGANALGGGAGRHAGPACHVEHPMTQSDGRRFGHNLSPLPEKRRHKQLLVHLSGTASSVALLHF